MNSSTVFTYVVIWIGPEAWPLQSQIVAADTVEERDGGLLILRDERPVFQARLSDVAHIERHTSLRDARRAFDERRAARGRGGLRVEEFTAALGRTSSGSATARGGPAEGIGFRVGGD